jgi:acyl-CoA synthetase (AMP-forming)/AMP-acid ligase II
MNVGLVLDMAAEGFPDRTVIGPRITGITAARLRQLAAGGARQLVSSEADALIYIGVAGLAFPVALFAAARAGIPLIPLNYRLGAEQLLRLMGNHPRAQCVVDDALRRSLPVPRSLSPQDWLRVASQTGDVEAEARDPDRPAAIVYTSGTTSKPKGSILRHENLAAYVLNSVGFATAAPEETSLISVPTYHIAGISNVLTNLYAGRRVVMLDSFTPRRWLAAVREEQVTNAMVVPTMLARLMGSGLDLSVPSLRSLAYGGAKMPPRVIRRALQEWRHVDFVNAYGLTETSSTISILTADDHRTALSSEDAAVAMRLHSVGRVIPSVELEIRDEAGAVVPTGVTGRIWLRGGQVSGEYVGQRASVDDRGFFDSRDRGRLDEDGYLFIDGRIDDTIIRGGENIAPAEIEDVLMRASGVADAVVVGVPDDEWGQRIEAAVVPVPGHGIDPEALRDEVRAVLRGSKTPEYIACWAALPRNATGKVLRHQVIARLVDERRPTVT